ncbi:MAG TPA: hypothetical protein VME43_31755 [Bryobacteraceae bacterium]|nr:hypothetical protein [Bryobacteraceae bacterium]
MHLPALLLSLALTAAAAEIPEGTHVLLRMVNSINTRTAREGDYVYLRTASPIVDNGQIVVPTESYVQGVVSKTVRSGKVKGRAELALRIETLTLASGQTIHVAPHPVSVDAEGTGQRVNPGDEHEIEQGKDTGKDAATVGTLGGAGAALGGLTDRSWTGAGIGAGAGAAVGTAIVLLTRGHEVVLHTGTTLDVVFARAIPIP